MTNNTVVSMENIHKKYIGTEIETHALARGITDHLSR